MTDEQSIGPKNEPSLDIMPRSETAKYAMELGLEAVVPPPSQSRSSPGIVSLDKEPNKTENQTAREAVPVSSTDKAKLRVMRALVDEFREWLATLAILPGENTLTEGQRTELHRRLTQLEKLREPLTDYSDKQPQCVDMAEFKQLYENFSTPFKLVSVRAKAILANPVVALSIQWDQPSDSAPSELEATQPVATTDTRAFREFQLAVDEYEKARNKVEELYDGHVMQLFDLGDVSYVRASKELRDKFYRF